MKCVSLMWLFVMLLSTVAHAQTFITMNVGQTKTVRLSSKVKSATSSEPSLVSVKKKSDRDVALRGLQVGRSSVLLTTKDNDVVELEVQVIPEGSVVTSY